jgi:hypothetical protein
MYLLCTSVKTFKADSCSQRHAMLLTDNGPGLVAYKLTFISLIVKRSDNCIHNKRGLWRIFVM